MYESVRAFGVGTLDTEFVPFEVGHRDPPAAVDFTVISNDSSADRKKALYRIVSRPTDGSYVEVKTILHDLVFSNRDKHDPRMSRWSDKPGLCVARLVRIIGVVAVAV
jgi:hypothetical protein